MDIHVASVFGLGLGELVLIAAIALVVIGPERFPEFARVVVRTIRDVRGYVDDAKRELDKELRPIKKEIRQLEQYQPKRYFDEITNKVAEPKPAPGSQEFGRTDDEPGDDRDLEREPKQANETGGETGEGPEGPAEQAEASTEDSSSESPYAPRSEMDYDRESTPFPAKPSPYDPGADEDERYRD